MNDNRDVLLSIIALHKAGNTLRKSAQMAGLPSWLDPHRPVSELLNWETIGDLSWLAAAVPIGLQILASLIRVPQVEGSERLNDLPDILQTLDHKNESA